MKSKSVTPAINLRSFNCPHCGAHADQTWYAAHAEMIKNQETPQQWTLAEAEDLRTRGPSSQEEKPIYEMMVSFSRRMANGEVFIEGDIDLNRTFRVMNLNLSRCYSCKGHAVWIHDSIAHPPTRLSVEPNADLSEDTARDFNEAREIIEASPRGAAALLRLCIQKICKELGEPGKDINADIASLVRRGLDARIQQALDIVRVVGNESVHPGEMDLRDDRETALMLFDLVNLVADRMISEPKRVEAMYGKLPEGRRKAISERDKK